VETAVEVNGGAAALNTTDATLGNPFDARQILTLPSEGRNAVELLSLQAGVTYLGTNTDPASDSRSGAVHGARSDQTNITVDGLDNNDQLLGSAFTGVLRMPMDSLEEFRVTTSNANADAGRSSGAQVSLVTKSGTNTLHGSLYWYNRTRLGVANDWFNKQAQLESGEENKPGQLIRNTFGASVGGPILRDRLFFFAIYEGQRSREAVQQTQSVPMESLRQGTVNYTGADGSTYSLSADQLRSIDTGCLASGTCSDGNGPSAAVLNVWNGGDSSVSATEYAEQRWIGRIEYWRVHVCRTATRGSEYGATEAGLERNARWQPSGVCAREPAGRSDTEGGAVSGAGSEPGGKRKQ